MYIIHNATDKTILLSDLRAEIPRRGILDLEKVADRTQIEKSRDLKHALRTGVLQLGRHSVIHTRGSMPVTPPERVIEKEVIIEKDIDEEKIANIIRKVLSEEGHSSSPDLSDEVHKAVKSSMGDLVSSIREQLSNIHINTSSDQPQQDSPVIDPVTLANISQKHIEKVSKDIETSSSKKPKKVQVNIKDLKNLADELG